MASYGINIKLTTLGDNAESSPGQTKLHVFSKNVYG